MRVACLAVHYGKEYLAWAVRGVQDAVDEVHVFYTATPSYGFREEGVVCPDSEAELEHEARRFAVKPLFWHRIVASSEGAHRRIMHKIAAKRGAELYAVADADEIWDGAALAHAMNYVHQENRAGRWLVHFAHFWRSFRFMIDEHFTPIRICDLRHPPTLDAYLPTEEQPWPVFHFGYAQSVAMMRYKFTCHGHKAEFIPNWLENVFEPWTPDTNPTTPMHPGRLSLWFGAHPTPPHLLQHVRQLLHDHPYLDVPLIR